MLNHISRRLTLTLESSPNDRMMTIVKNQQYVATVCPKYDFQTEMLSDTGVKTESLVRILWDQVVSFYALLKIAERKVKDII